MDPLASKQVYAGPGLDVREETIRRPDGSEGTVTVVEAGDIVLVVPVEGDRLHLVEQYRDPIRARSWEFPSGDVEAGVDPDVLAAADRELREETGLRSQQLRVLGIVDVAPSTSTQRCTVVLATGLSPGAPARDPGEQDMRSASFTRDDVARMVEDGTMSDSKSLAALALLWSAGT